MVQNLTTIETIINTGVNLKKNNTSNKVDFQALFEKQTNLEQKNNLTPEKKATDNNNTSITSKNIIKDLDNDSNKINNKDVEENLTKETAEENEEIIDEEIKINNNIINSVLNALDTETNESDEDTKTKDINNENINFNILSEIQTLKTLGDLKTTSQESTEIIQTSKKTSIDTFAEKAEIEEPIEEISDDEMSKIEVESVDVETGDNSNSESNLEQSPQEHVLKATINSDVDFGETKTEVKIQQTQTTNKTVDTNTTNTHRIIEQISKQLESLNSGSKVNIVLNPESLGKVSVQLINTKEGLSAQFTVATQEARNLIMKGLDGLKDSLMLQGINIDNITVKTNETNNSEFKNNWTDQEGSRGGNKEQNPRHKEKNNEEFDKMMNFIDEENGNV